MGRVQDGPGILQGYFFEREAGASRQVRFFV